MEYKIVTNKQEGLEQVKQLIEQFNEYEDRYKSEDYREEPTKQQFINPFFESLGWDVTNKKGNNPDYCDVTTEESIETGDGKKAPDYSFRINGSTVFYVEAKKPSVNIKNDICPSFQLRRYGWSSNLDISILTDFEELSIYTTKIDPKKSDTTSIERVKYYRYTDNQDNYNYNGNYISKWDEIWSIISKEAVENGSLERFANENTKKTVPVDNHFLDEIEKWRSLLSENIVKNNGNITDTHLNYSVQVLINRIIFLRMAEDRKIEPYGQLKNLLKNNNVYSSFIQLCIKCDKKYNSGLFHFKERKNISRATDSITPNLKIDNNVFTKIFKNLYY
ncbi:MAG: restriction endonuclease subunit M, partial [Methanosphaera sp.]|nr:restriction endonuclease subunit M [Methanosphaera sp.]